MNNTLGWRSRASLPVEPPDRDANLLCLVGQIVLNARSREHHDAYGQDFQQGVVAPERSGLAMPVPVGLKGDLWNFAMSGPTGSDEFRPLR